MNTVAEIRDSLRAARLNQKQDYLANPNPARYLRAHAQLVDRHLRMVWQMQGMPKNLALIAVGGFGRGELFPRSDIDLLILLPQQPDEALEQRLQELVGKLWDIGLEVGHSVRTIDECLAESSDVTVQTNLLEARLITGSRALFTRMNATLSANLDKRAFFLAKSQEQEQRYTRYLDIDFNLEPNIKESPGGLRDLQTVLWISRAGGFGDSWKELAAAGLMTTQESRAVARHEALLQTLRIRLHFLANRREDRVLFDFQTELAEQMNITATETRRASEHLMQHYYRTKRAVVLLNAVLLQNMRDHLFPEGSVISPINERFLAHDDKLELRDAQLFEKEPSAIFESFLIMEQHPELTGFSASTAHALWSSRHRIDAAFRRDPHNRKLFMDILRQPRGITHVLRRMSRNGILGSYLPAFGRIVGQMQHDLFHVYTVDEHILMVVHNLRCFALEKHAPEHPLGNKLMKDFARPEVLYIAGLFHDIAKGRGGDHAKLGRADAARFCKQHGMTREDSELVVWLVEHHLAFSATAQTQDLSDQDVIAAFADKIPNDRYLVALYLLTVADVRGTSPKVWNVWKGKLFDDLFHATRRFMTGGKIADQVGEIRQRTREVLNLYAIGPELHELLWGQFDAHYFLQHEPDEIAWHTRLLAHRVNSPVPVVKARLSRMGEGIQVMVYCPDQSYLFARICGFFSRLNYNIMEAKIHTTQHGYALDSFLVMDASGRRTNYRDVMNFIEYELAQELVRAEPLAAPQFGRVSRQLKHFPIVPHATITPDVKGKHRLFIIAGDRPGLLASIAYTLARHKIELHSAKIITLGARAEDMFWISGDALDKPQEVEALCETLKKQLA